jgi:DNA-binding transcriptional ArsR family regulator
MPQVFWDWGTAYDLFMSLEVLHTPADFGVRGAWAAGVRARLPAAEREILEQVMPTIHVPLHWIYTLPEPKDTMTVLYTLGQVPPEERLAQLTLHPEGSEEIAAILNKVAARSKWDEQDLAALQAIHKCDEEKAKLTNLLDLWSRNQTFGEQYLVALRAYYEVFFAEEEKRIRPALQEALAQAQDLAERLDLPDLLEELSQGLRFSEPPNMAELVLVPSFWSTPLVLFGKVNARRALWLFGARPSNASLVPGEVVPDALLRALKALSDPTRLRIMHYLAQEPLPPSQLARRLRLRASTVTHHVRALRLAGLVQLTLGEGKEEKRYAARFEAVEAACTTLKTFLREGQVQGTKDADS